MRSGWDLHLPWLPGGQFCPMAWLNVGPGSRKKSEAEQLMLLKIIPVSIQIITSQEEGEKKKDLTGFILFLGKSKTERH